MIIPPSVSVLRKAKRMKPSSSSIAKDKRGANRIYRRQLNAITRGFVVEPLSFYNETFQVKTYTSWDYV